MYTIAYDESSGFESFDRQSKQQSNKASNGILEDFREDFI